jgi:hypothetical protein
MKRLKSTSPAFEVTDGLFAGRKYLHGQTYAEIPPQEAEKFEEVEPVDPEINPASAVRTEASATQKEV